MSYLAIYRRFRPTDFDQVIGQEHVVKTLINQINTQRVGHAYLFCGARGTGKTSVAKIFARAINCLDPQNGSPCGVCEACKSLAVPTNLDILEIDAASNNKVDNVQEIRSNVQYPPVAGKYKVYIIDEVHMLTTEAFNALLKTLEEPPSHAVFILATTEPQKLPATILSRCMRFDFHLVADQVIQKLIEDIYKTEGKDYEKEAVALIAKSGEGSVRDALSLADLCLSYNNEKLTYKQVIDLIGASDSTKTMALVGAVLDGDIGEVLTKTEGLITLGKSVNVLTNDVCAMIRDILVVKTCSAAKDILMIPQGEYDMLKKLADKGDSHRLLRVLENFAQIETELKYSTHPRVVFETAAVKSTLPAEDYNFDALIGRIAALEKKLALIEEKGVKIDTAVKTVDGAVENPSYKVAELEAPKMEQKDEKPAYKPVIDHIEEEKPAVKVDDSPKKISRLAGFDYVSDEDVPPIDDSFAPPENQIGFEIDGFFEPSREESKKPLHTEDKTPEQPQKPQQVAAPTAKGSVLRDRVSDARLWGTVLKKLRADKNLMLWVACQDLDTKIEENILYVLVDGENEYNLLLKPESKAVLKAAVNTFAPYDVVIKRVGVQATEEDKFLQDAEAVNKMFDGKITVKD